MNKAQLLALIAQRTTGTFESKVVEGFRCGIRRLKGLERDEHELRILNAEGKPDLQKFKNHRARLVQMCLCDESNANEKIFTLEEVANFDNDLLQEAYEACRTFNNMTKEAAEGAAGNSD